MTSSEQWTCSGIPINGEEYPGFGGEHEAYENYSTNCDICGLPRESQKEPKPKLPIKAIAAIAVAITLAGGGAAYTFVAKGCDTGLEKIEGQCIDPFLQPYQEATKQGDDAIAIAANYQSVEDLEKAQSILGNALSQLSQIPSEALVYPKVATKLQEYQGKNTEISSNLEKEKVALEKLGQAETIALEATSKTEGDRTTSELTAAKQKWEEAKNTLNEIDSTSLVTSQVEKYRSDYDLQLSSIDSRIAAMNRPPATRAKPSVRVNRQPVRTQPQIKPSYSKNRNRNIPAPVEATPVDRCAGANKAANCVF